MKHRTTIFISAIAFIIIIISLFLLKGCNYERPPLETPDTLIPVEYTPMQCDITPWDSWLQNSSIRFIRAPTEQEVLNMFYSNVYNITLSDITIVNTSEVVCEACSVCSKGYWIKASVKLKEIQIMLDTGWKRMLYL